MLQCCSKLFPVIYTYRFIRSVRACSWYGTDSSQIIPLLLIIAYWSYFTADNVLHPLLFLRNSRIPRSASFSVGVLRGLRNRCCYGKLTVNGAKDHPMVFFHSHFTETK